MAITLNRTVPILRIFDEAKAREFYIEYLRFTIDFEHRFHDNAPLFMGISRGAIKLYLSEHHGDGTPGTVVVVEMTGIDELLEELKAKNYKYYNPTIQEQEWGARELGVVDPFKNTLVFAERIAESKTEMAES